mmetsp:Transcript_21249/g.62044  ORF Transcript_21249/g.62044 Transcript_21249/m.62044 type:complete len:88 (+) Transcript_21249:101-364(+)
MKVKVKRWHGVATWSWNVNDECCGICRMPFEACCPDCKAPGDDCPPMWGRCNHAFHIHCIMKWLEKNTTCPMCRQDWQYKNDGDEAP